MSKLVRHMPTLYARFYNNSTNLYSKVKEVARNDHFSSSIDDPVKGILHLHTRIRGKTVHLILYIGNGNDRGITISILPGDEGWYMNFGRQFIDSLKEVAK